MKTFKAILFGLFVIFSGFANAQSDMKIQELSVGCYLDARELLKEVKVFKMKILSEKQVVSGANIKESKVLRIFDPNTNYIVTLLLRNGEACVLYAEKK